MYHKIPIFNVSIDKKYTNGVFVFPREKVIIDSKEVPQELKDLMQEKLARECNPELFYALDVLEKHGLSPTFHLDSSIFKKK